MADSDLNQNQPQPNLNTSSINPPTDKPKIIDPLDEPLENQSPEKILPQPNQSSVNQTPISKTQETQPPPIQPASKPFEMIKPATNIPPSTSPTSDATKISPVTPSANSTQPVAPTTMPAGQFKLPTEEIIAQEKQKIQSTSPSPLPPQNKIDNKNINPPPALSLSSQSPILNQKPNLKNTIPPPLSLKKKKRSFFKIFLLIILILIIILGGLAGITYAGIEIPYVSKFISQYLPISSKKDFTKSIVSAQDAVKKASYYGISTSISLGESLEDTTADSTKARSEGNPPALPGVMTESNAIAWNNMIISTYGTRKADGKISGTISIAPSSTAGEVSIFQVSYDFAFDKNLLYLHPLGLFDEDATNWQAIDLKEIEKNKLLSMIFQIMDLNKLLPMFESGEWQAKEDVTIKSRDNKDLGTITANKFDITNTNIGDTSIGDVKTTLYIADNEFHPVKAAATATIKDQSGRQIPVKIESYFFNFDVEQKIEIPQKDDYAMIALDTFLTNNGFYSGSTIPDNPSQEADARDQTRKADLAKLESVLAEYKDDKGIYPITSRVEKTNEAGVLKEALAPDYLESLPIDPLDPDYWYGYNSDGYTYHITSIIEGNDASAKQGAKVKYQEIIK